MQGYSILSTPLALARQFLQNVLGEGDLAIDATLGKGRDLLFLLDQVGDSGKVWGFDIQKEALEQTSKILGSSKAELIWDSHSRMDVYCPTDAVKAIMFNLGYLPGGDHLITTRAETTEVALEKALVLLKPGGLLTIVVYHGHPCGLEEKEMLEQWVDKLDCQKYGVIKLDFLNRPNQPPFLLIIEKRQVGVAHD